MSAGAPHVLDELQLRLDRQLDQAALSRVETHLESCATCRRAAEELARARDGLRALPVSPLPAALAAEIDRLLAAEAAKTRSAARWPWLGAAGLAAAAVVLLAIWIWRPESLASSAARDVLRVTSGALPLDLHTTEPAALERQFAARGLPVRVLDLAMMGWQLEGGRVHTLGTRSSALYVYRRADGRRLVCQMFRGTMAELPRAEITRESGAFTFAVFHEGVQTLVFWQEGDILCVLGSDLPSDEVIALAIAKAMKPA